jgi:hypothetical protein
MIGRTILTLLVLGGALFGLHHEVSTLVVGKVAGSQFEASDLSYLTTQAVFHGFRALDAVLGFVTLGLLAVVWWTPVRRVFTALGILAVAGTLLTAPEARAYYQQTDYAEPYFILTNESAFFVPDVGDNKNDQAKFGSEEYYARNKIAAKRFEIPHAKLSNSSVFSNYYVPAGRLIIVDRTPVQREWVKAGHRGTGTNDQSFPCQSSEGHDITVGVAIGATVFEDDAPKFLYRFGVNAPKGERTDPNVIFTSVYYGKSLAQAMDGPVRTRVQALVCDEMSKRTLNDANTQAGQIMADIEKKVKAYMLEYGIHLDFIGWADTFEFDKDIQASLTRKYVASKDLEIARDLAPHTGTLQALATAEAIRTLAGKWKGDLPGQLTMMGSPSDMFGKLFTPSPTVVPEVKPATK